MNHECENNKSDKNKSACYFKSFFYRIIVKVKNKVNKYNPLLRRVVKFIMFLFTKLFRISAVVPEDVKKINAPYLLLSNHIGLFDPFVIGYFLKDSVQFVASDAAFHTRFMRWFLSNLGVIKKKKNIRDGQMIRDLISVIKEGYSVGIFPEGTRSWTGSTLPIDASLGKLVKLLNVPVVTAKLKGMQLFNPRWYPGTRPTQVEIEYRLSISGKELKALNANEIFIRILKDIKHDEVAYQRVKMSKIQSIHRAEYINHVLFICPECRSIGQIKSKGNNFGCFNCGSKTHIDNYGFFEPINRETVDFNNIRDWFNWQTIALKKLVKVHFDKGTTEALFFDDNMDFFEEEGEFLTKVGSGRLSFFIDKIVFNIPHGKTIELPISDIQTISPQLKERIELFYNDKALRIVGHERGVSGVKWEIATNTIWRLTDKKHKVSSYFNEENEALLNQIK